MTTRSHDLLHITKALLAQPTCPDFTRMLIRQPSQGRILPLVTPLSGSLLIGSAFELRGLPVWSYGDSNPRPLACHRKFLRFTFLSEVARSQRLVPLSPGESRYAMPQMHVRVQDRHSVIASRR